MGKRNLNETRGRLIATKGDLQRVEEACFIFIPVRKDIIFTFLPVGDEVDMDFAYSIQRGCSARGS